MTVLGDIGVFGRVTLGATRYRLTGRRMPLTVFLSVTNRCDALCAHCAMPFRAQRELSPPEMLDLVDAIADQGAQVIVLTGGEPLARRDVGAIVERCAVRGLWTRLETNGYRFPELADELAGLSHLVVSLEGSEDAHDRIREPGAWARARVAVVEARRRGIRTSTLTILTRHNLASLGDVVAFAEAHGAMAEFRLLHHVKELDGGSSCQLQPPAAELRRALRQLVEWRRQGRPVATTTKALRTMLAWDDYAVPALPWPHEDQVCLAGQTHCFVDADGSVYACRQRVGEADAGNAREGFADAWDRTRANDCQACVAADLCERNLLDNLNVPALLGLAANRARRG